MEKKEDKYAHHLKKFPSPLMPYRKVDYYYEPYAEEGKIKILIRKKPRLCEITKLRLN